jgi:hypothetical protein
LTVCLCFFLLCVYTCETGMSHFYCQFHVPDEILTKLKEIFFQQITHIFIFFSSLYNGWRWNIPSFELFFSPLYKPRLLILLSLYGYQPFFQKSIR